MIHPDLPEKALAIRQPWAWAIVHGSKRIENRTWQTKYRGPVCIHASKGLKSVDVNAYHDTIGDRGAGYALSLDSLECGGIIGVADIVDCVDRSESMWFFGPYGFVLDNVRPVPFIPVNGALGFFDWRKRLQEAI